MIEAVKTTASPAEIWAIVVVAVACLAFWLGAVAWADRHPLWRDRQVPEMPGPVLGGMHLGSGGRSVAPNREAPSVLTNVDEEPYDQRDYDPEHEMAAQWREAPEGTGEYGEYWVPVQRGPQPWPSAAEAARAARAEPAHQVPAQAQPTQAQPPEQAVPAMPAQRTSEADQPADIVTGPGPGPGNHGGSRHWWSRHR